MANLTGGDQRGQVYGLYALVAGLGVTISPLVGGWLYKTGGPAILFSVNGVVLTVSTLVLWALLQVPNRVTSNL